MREALVNALIHADYEAATPLLVIKRPDGFSFRNPGTPRLSLDQIRAGGVSDCRNRTLQRMFLLLGIGETAGSGFSRILRAWREQSWRAPALAVTPEPEMTMLDLPTSSLLPDEVVRSLAERYGERFEALFMEERIAVVTAAAEGRITNERLREQTAMHPRDATLLLSKLATDGLLRKHGERRDAWYSLEGPAHGDLPLFAGSGDGESDASSGGPDASSDASSDTSSATDGAIVAACKGGFKTVTEIAAVSGYAPVTVRRRLTALLASGALLRRFPDRPRHPRQAYRAAATDNGAEP